ncbi:MAG: hypothetical protein F2563_02385 [Actinobacteria bacterium]|nr:hypothetical protein [Actinomycetota bacterium]
MDKHQAHKLLKNHMILALSEAGAYVWANETGSVQSIKGHYIQYGHKGSSDILGVWNGKFIAIEAKTGKGVQSPQQKIFEKNVTEQRGVYYVAKWDGIEPIKDATQREVGNIRKRITRDI